jgi:hypothetical protein
MSGEAGGLDLDFQIVIRSNERLEALSRAIIVEGVKAALPEILQTCVAAARREMAVVEAQEGRGEVPFISAAFWEGVAIDLAKQELEVA